MTFPSDLEDLLDEGRVAVRSLVRIAFGDGVYGVWNGVGELVTGGVTYVPNGLIRVEEAAGAMGSQAIGIRIEMPESADFGVTPDVLAQIETMDYKGRRVTVYDAYFDPDTRELLHVEPLYDGYVDRIDHVVESGQMKLVGHVETAALDNHRDGYRLASHEDQQLVSAGDRFFEHAATAGIETFEITLS